MRRRKSFIYFVVVVFALAHGSSVFSQIKSITEEEFISELRKPGNQPLKQGRIIGFSETLHDGIVVGSWLETTEGIPPSRVRVISKITTGDKVIEIERISIGPKDYQRVDGGPWDDIKPLELGTGVGFELFNIKSKQDRYSVQPGTLDGKSVRIYESVEKCSVNKQRGIDKQRFWIGLDGNLYQSERMVTKLPSLEVVLRQKITYAYDVPDLKIEPPIK